MKAAVLELSLADYTHGPPNARDSFCSELMRGLQRYGFVVMRDHAIPAALLDAAYELCATFFGQPDEIKRRYIGGARGYAPYRTEHAKDQQLPDLKEFWQMGPECAVGVADTGAGSSDAAQRELPNIWPDWPARFKDTFLELFEALQGMGQRVLEALTPALGVPAGFFEPLLASRNSVLRLLHYPPLEPGSDPGSTRSAAHEDINLITLLIAPQGPGLELKDRDGHWLPVQAGPHHVIVDSGDMLARLTNDVIPATTHRVVNPTDTNVSRYSMPFFMHPDSDVVLRCLRSCVGAGAKYADIRSGAFLEQRLREIGLVQENA